MTKTAISFGEVVIDDFPDRRVVAGSPLHVAVYLRTLGWDAFLLTRVGDDQDGRAVRAVTDRFGIDPSLIEVDDKLPTGLVTVSLRGSEPTFLIHQPSAWDDLRGPPDLPEHDVFCFGSLIGRSPRSFATLRRLLAASQAFKAFDVNLRPPTDVGAVIELGLDHAALVKVNEFEFAEVAKRLGLAPGPAAFFARAPRLQWLTVTRGRDGAALWSRDGNHWESPGRRVDAVDTVGAGDAFFAAMVRGLVELDNPEAALEVAQDTAGEVMSHRGGLPPH